MPSDPLLAEMERATHTAWVVTGMIGVGAGVALLLVFRAAARVTRMPVLSTIIAVILGVFVFVGLQPVRYRIEEAPFEPPTWIHPGLVSLYLPAVAIILGVVVTAGLTRQVAAR